MLQFLLACVLSDSNYHFARNSSRRGQTQWKYKMKSMESNGKTTAPQETQSPRPQTKLSADMSPALIAQANWTFVEKLLKVQ